jgi:hypothetical protein
MERNHRARKASFDATLAAAGASRLAFHFPFSLLHLHFPVGLILLSIAIAIPCPAQTPQKIIDEYLRAEGGAKALARIQTASFAGSIRDETSGENGTYSLITKSPNRFYSEITLEPQHFTQAHNGMSSWGQGSAGGPHTLTGREATVAEASARYLNGRLANVRKDKVGLRLVGTENVRGRCAYQVELTLAPGVLREIFFDTSTHLILRETLPPVPNDSSVPDQGGEQFDYDDYRPVNGILEPFHVELRRGGHTYLITATRVELNGSVADFIFDFPREEGRPLPDIPALLRDLNKNQKVIEQIQRQYTCHLSEEEDKRDSNGQVTSHSVKEYDIFYVADEEVRHLLAKDGKLLTPTEQHKEDERFNKEFDELKKKQAEFANDPKKLAKQEEKDEAQISDFLRGELFTNPHRERFRGQEVIVFDFGPNPDYKPKKLIDRLIHNLVGVMWVDEKAHDVARLEARFSDNFKIGGGLLASLQKGSSFAFEQAMVNNEVWLPSYMEIHVAARVLFLKARMSVIDRFSNYKKFEVETKLGPVTPN